MPLVNVNSAKQMTPSRRSTARILCSLAGGALVIDALVLMVLRVIHFGVIVPLLLGLVLSALGLWWQPLHAWMSKGPLRRRLWSAAWAAFWMWLLSLALFFVFLDRSIVVSAGPAQPPAAVIIVLGSGIIGGKVSPVLAARLDTALQRAQLQRESLVLVSGGVDAHETRSEAEVMGDYLRSHGLDAARIAQEDKSLTTQENLQLSRAMLARRGLSVSTAPIELVTSDFHTVRARWLADREAYGNVRTVSAPTPLYARYNGWLREYFAFVHGFVRREF